MYFVSAFASPVDGRQILHQESHQVLALRPETKHQTTSQRFIPGGCENLQALVVKDKLSEKKASRTVGHLRLVQAGTAEMQ